MFRLLSIVLIFGLIVTSVHAQTDTSSFLVRVFGGTDTEAPSTPILSGTAIAPTQIDISWTTAIDNFLVSGYVVFRDGVPLATTTQTSFSDAALVASTTYSYFVRAFDPTFNYSSSSNTVLITTPDAVVPPTPSEGTSGGTATKVVLDSLDITALERSALFLIRTIHPARFEIRWGKSTSYELGYTLNEVYASSYKTSLTDLEPGTLYQYEVIAYTPFGKPTVLEKGKFSTKSLTDSFPPTNVAEFSGVRAGDNVQLRWVVPSEADVASVRIVRSHLGFPTHIQDGVVVYQGLGSSFTDENILRQYSPVYYTAFVVDDSGTVSSGAVARVYALAPGVTDDGTTNPPIPSGIDTEIKDETVASTSQTVPAGTRMPTVEEINLQQKEVKISLGTQGIVLASELPFLLAIPKSAVSDNLKTIIASLTDPTDSRRTYSFMLRINKDQTAYEAVLPPVMLEGKSRLIIDIYDYESQIVANYQKTIEFKKDASSAVVPVFPDRIISAATQYGWVISVLLFGFLILSIFFRRKKKLLEDNL